MKKILNILFLMVMTVSLSAQTTLTFEGKDRTGQDYVQLSRVSVFDLDQLWHQEIYYPDTTLVLYVNGTVGVETWCTASLQMQNNPNPFDGTTDVVLSTPYEGDVTMEITDVDGHIVGTHRVRPQSGTHQFRLTLSAPGTYVLTARQNGHTVSVKMVNAGNGGNNGIEYTGTVETGRAPSLQLKSGTRGNGNYPFNRGDLMRYTGYAVVDSVEIESEMVQKSQNGSETIPLKFDVARPEVVTNDATNVAATAAMLHGEVTADNNASVTERGFCYGTGNNPSLSGLHVPVNGNVGTFSTQVGGLSPATNYKVRAYATNMVGTSYGEQKTFRTMDTLPVVTTTEPTDITATTFTSGGDVLVLNSNSLTARGICWNTTGAPTIADSHTTQSGGLGSFSSDITGLDCSTIYYVRAYATNSVGTAYGEEYSVTTMPPTIPDVALPSATIYNGLNIATQAEVLTENCSAVTERGVCWSTSHNPTLEDSHTVNGEGIGAFNDTLTNLEIAANYYIRAYATNELGTAYSEEAQVVTSDYPTVTTSSFINITATTATSGGSVTSDGGATVTARGVCWNTTGAPSVADDHSTDGNGTGSFTSSLTGLTANTTYYVRAYATNSVGTAYGNEVSFTTETPQDGQPCRGAATLTDIDGNTYNTVQIGTQCWMKENLRTTKYADGTSISQGSSTSTTTGYWYYPDNDASNKTIYGLLYNWKAVMRNSSSSSANPSGVQGICPTGWHVPSDAEFTQLTDYVSSQSQYVCGSNNTYIAKALAGTTGWSTDTGTCCVGNMPSQNNSTGFSALPAGYYNGSYGGFGYYPYFWSATEYDSSRAWNRNLYYWRAFVNRTYSTKAISYSVRCLRDEGGSTTSHFPTITTSSVTDITSTTATSGGSITSDGGATVTARGVCWNTTGAPSVADDHSTDGNGTGSFTSSLTGLTANTTYYVRAYATNSVGTAYGNEVSFTTETPQDGQPCRGAATLTDIDGNTYNTVQIGAQCWMKENLRTTKYADGTSISQGSSTSTTTSYWYYPNDDATNKPTYGLLYNWNAVMRNSSSSSANPSGVQGVCPTGWHVPSDAEFTQLTDYVSSQSQYVCGSNNTYIAKALAGTTGWSSSTYTCAVGNMPSQNNSTGFGALPAGGYWEGCFNFGSRAFFWSATENDSSLAWFRNLGYTGAYVSRNDVTKTTGYSVRCLRDEGGSTTSQFPTITTSSVTDITSTTATSGGSITSDGGATVTARGVCWSTTPNPTIAASHTTDGNGTGSFTSSLTGLTANTTYYVRAYATNSVGTAYGNEVSFTTEESATGQDGQPCPDAATLTDIDGNTYNTVQIGTQCWMKENLRTTKYADGTSISQGSSTSTTVAYWYYPNGDASNKPNYGLLYNWKSVMRNSSSSNTNPSGVQGICPTGWHVPSDAEWTQLTDYVSNQSEFVCGSNNAYIARALAGTFGWGRTSYNECAISENLNENNETGFSVVPSGCYGTNPYFSFGAYFWSTTEDDEEHAWRRGFYYSNALVDRYNNSKDFGLSVRCLRNEGEGTTGQDSQPCPGTPTVIDVDGNTYNTVQIGTQCWMKENLKATHFADNTEIPEGTDAHHAPGRSAPDNDESNVHTYGYLYNWMALMYGATSSDANPSGVQGVCPSGWHVPSNAEWTQLTDYVSSQNQYVCGSNNTYIAKALASATGWSSSTSTCTVGNTPSDNNATGFSALPAGYCDDGECDYPIGSQARFWSATSSAIIELSDLVFAYSRSISRNSATVQIDEFRMYDALSVRCLRDEGGSTASQLPTVTTSSVTDITSSTATSGGSITSDGGATVTARGVCWSTTPNPTIAASHTTDGNGTGSFTSSLTGLTANTTYYVRAYATNSVGTAYGNEVSFTTEESATGQDGQPCPDAATLTDRDGNTYNTVQIGTQCWMKENLRTTKYADGTSISQGSSTSTTVAYWYYPNNNSSNKPTYGLLYNWKAVMRNSSSSSANPSGVQGVCPTGWHVPSDAEWTQLTDYVSSQSQYQCNSTSAAIGKALAGTTGWRSCTDPCVVGNTPSGNNATGFSALPAGYYLGGSSYFEFSYRAYFWSATEERISSNNAYRYYLRYDGAGVGRIAYNKTDGYSVRCVRD